LALKSNGEAARVVQVVNVGVYGVREVAVKSMAWSR
jgi:hypothetical protein